MKRDIANTLVKYMPVEDLVMQGARASAAMVSNDLVIPEHSTFNILRVHSLMES